MNRKAQLITKLDELFNLHKSHPFPRKGHLIQHYILYDSYIAGIASRVIMGEPVKSQDIPDGPGEEIANSIVCILQNSDKESQLLDEHYQRLEEMRSMLKLVVD